jgi:hypothetical protein
VTLIGLISTPLVRTRFEVDHAIKTPRKALWKRSAGAHSLQGGQRRFQTGRRNDYTAVCDRFAIAVKPGPFTIASIGLPYRLTPSRHGTRDETHKAEQTPTPCRRNAPDPVKNPPTQLRPSLDIEMTGFNR